MESVQRLFKKFKDRHQHEVQVQTTVQQKFKDEMKRRLNNANSGGG